ncbi:class II aldolase/adducin family protein [bacterium]|nr:class II aldolase/adducin family protein [bacterium]
MKRKIIELGRLLYQKDLTSATSGNISYRSGNKVYITATGTALGFLDENNIVEIDMEGKEFNSQEKASSEKFMHLAIYKIRKDIKAIIHCHAPFTTAFAACRKELSAPIIAENILYFGKIPVAEYGMPSSKKLTENTSKLFQEYDTVLMANHGIVVGGDDLMNAFFKLETAETYAKTYIYSKILNEQAFLSNQDIDDLYILKNKLHSK